PASTRMPSSSHRVKIRRKDLRRPDEFKTLATEAGEWLVAHRALAFGVAGALVVVTLVALLVGWYSASRNHAAGVAFRSAHETFQAGKYAEAAASFGALADEYGSTSFGRLAALYRGHALARQGGAAAAYEAFLAGGRAAPYLRQEALDGLGHVQEASGNAAAVASYTQAADLDGPYKADALMNAARLEDAAGHADTARALWARLEKEAPDPAALEVARAKLGQQASAAPPSAPAAAPPESPAAN